MTPNDTVSDFELPEEETGVNATSEVRRIGFEKACIQYQAYLVSVMPCQRWQAPERLTNERQR